MMEFPTTYIYNKQERNERKCILEMEKKPFNKIILISLILSIAIHLVPYLNLNPLAFKLNTKNDPSHYTKVRIHDIKIVSKKQPILEENKNNRIIEQKLKQNTETPTPSKFLAEVDHKTKIETQVKKNLLNSAIDPGSAAKAQKEQLKFKKAMPQEQTQKAQTSKASKKLNILSSNKGIEFKADQQTTPRNPYEKLLSMSSQKMIPEMKAGYQDYIDEKLKEADTIDLNTQQYRFIGYFATMRKAIQLAWVYPSQAAQRGIDGTVTVHFTIHKTGKVVRVDVKDSSGSPILDDAIVDAIRLAGPFAPLPGSMQKAYLNVTGTFNYTLTGL